MTESRPLHLLKRGELFGLFLVVFFFKVRGKFLSNWCTRSLISDAGKWVAPFGFHSNSVPVPNESEFCDYIASSSDILQRFQRKNISGNQMAW